MKKVFLLVVALMLTLILGCGGNDVAATSDTPEGALKGYFQSLQDKNYEQAYGFLKTATTKEQFIEDKKSSPMSFKGFEVKDIQVTGNKATGLVVFQTGSKEMPEVSLNAELEKEGDNWLITNLGMGGGMGGSGMPPAGSEMPPADGGTPPADDKKAPSGDTAPDKE